MIRILEMKIFFNMLFQVMNRFKNLFSSNAYTVQQQAISLALGAYVAFCPFIGFHTVIMLFFAWMWSLNGPLMICFSYLINNPWTMIPLYFFDYWVGIKIITLFGLENLQEPAFMVQLNNLLQAYFKEISISGWAFLMGGNFVALIAGVMTYCGAFLLLKNFRRS